MSFSTLGSASSTLDYEVALPEGDSVWLENGYVLTIVDIDTYYGYAEVSLSWNGHEVLNSVYYPGDYFDYDDNLITLEFDIGDIYSDSYADYVNINGLYIFYKDFPQGTIMLYSVPEGYDVYINSYYQVTSDGYNLIQLSDLEPGYHSLTLESAY
ncbi:MAG: hypothetical protein ACQESU_09570, partial [Halobacteriota archaeon]